MVISGFSQNSENFESPDIFKAEDGQGGALPSCFNSHAINECSICGLEWTLLCHFFAFLCFLLVISLFEMAPKCSTEMLFIIPKNTKFLRRL